MCSSLLLSLYIMLPINLLLLWTSAGFNHTMMIFNIHFYVQFQLFSHHKNTTNERVNEPNEPTPKNTHTKMKINSNFKLINLYIKCNRKFHRTHYAEKSEKKANKRKNGKPAVWLTQIKYINTNSFYERALSHSAFSIDLYAAQHCGTAACSLNTIR